MKNKIKSTLKHIYERKVRYSGILITLLYLIDQAFDISERCNLSSGWVITSVTIVFLVIGYAINAKRIDDDTNIFEDYINEQKELYKIDNTESKKNHTTNTNDCSDESGSAESHNSLDQNEAKHDSQDNHDSSDETESEVSNQNSNSHNE